MESQSQEQNLSPSPFAVQDFYSELATRVSGYNAKLILDMALIEVGFDFTEVSAEEKKLNCDEAKNLCLELIKQGGPAFQVGKNLYHQIQ
ncbi:MAG: hypothetical protein KDD50_07305 [Bdellovibrionales bacterium]|nr:hypothetical protein [Bdellovibrionales bacterium]